MAGRPTQRRPSQKQRILEALRGAGPAGCSNRQLNEICFRYTPRMDELRSAGFRIETIRESAGLFRFVLRGEPHQQESARPVSDYSAEMERQLHDRAVPLFAGVR